MRADQNSDGNTPLVTETTRRGFSATLLDLFVLSWAGVLAYGVLRFLTPPQSLREHAREVKAPVTLAAIKREKSVVFAYGDRPAILISTDKEGLRAFLATCSHLACVVEFNPQREILFCPCHNGGFDLTGRNIFGPPPRPLTRLAVETRGQEIYVRES